MGGTPPHAWKGKNMGDITPHFSRSEFVCKCCGADGIRDELVTALERIRVFYGRPMVVSSGVRCEAHNAASGGKPGSAHVRGLAADIVCASARDRMELIRIAMSQGVSRIGVGKDFVHLDIDVTLPQDVLWLYGGA